MPQTYACFIRDRRYSVPTLRLFDAMDDESARRTAMSELRASGDHLAVELQDAGGAILLSRSRDGAPPR